MFEKFNEKAKLALFFSRSAANQLAWEMIDTHHILLGLFEIEDDVVSEIFRRYGIEANGIRAELGAEPVREHLTREIPLSEDVKKVLVYAAHEAETLGHLVAPAHLLFGIMSVDGTDAMRILAGRGANNLSLRQMILEFYGDPAYSDYRAPWKVCT